MTGIAGVRCFSQRAITTSLRLRQARSGDARWAHLRVGSLLRGGGHKDVMHMVGEKLEIPSVHGLRDPWLANRRRWAKCFPPMPR